MNINDILGTNIPPSSSLLKDDVLQNEQDQMHATYQHTVHKLNHLLDQNANKKLRVNAIRILGIQHTSSDIIQQEMQSTLKAQSLKDILEEMKASLYRLSRLGIFKSMDVYLDSPQDQDMLVSKEAVDIILTVEERGRVWGQTGTVIGNNEGGVYGSIHLRNLLGRAEKFMVNLGYGTRTASTAQITFTKPIRANPDRTMEVSLFKLNQNFMMHRNYEEILHGFSVSYSHLSRTSALHQLAYLWNWREIGRLKEQATFNMRQCAGHSVKSSIRYTFTQAHLDDILMPTQGYRIKSMSEIAGLGGDVSFIKNESELFGSIQLPGKVALSASTTLGLVHPLWLGNQKYYKTNLSDRFFLGGPTSLRGFRMDGVGPRNGDEAYGGDMYYLSTVALSTPIPLKPVSDWPVRVQSFANCGSLVRLADHVNESVTQTLGNTFMHMIHHPRLSVGLGLIIKAKIARIELNYSWPLKATGFDEIRKGFQIGVGVSFL